MINKKKELTKIYLLVLDLVCIAISFVLASWTRHGFPYLNLHGTIYGLAFILIFLCYICIYYFFDSFEGLFKRGFIEEFSIVMKNNILLILMITGILFAYQKGALYSRSFFACFFFYSVCVEYLARQYFKIFLLSYYRKSNSSNKIVVITTTEEAGALLCSMHKQPAWDYQITGIVILDKDIKGNRISGIPVIAGKDDIYEVIAKEAVDEVFISTQNAMFFKPDEMILEFENMGIMVNLSITGFSLKVKEKLVKEFAGFNVLTFSTKLFYRESMVLKRLLDIMGGVVGIIITVITGIFIVPAIWIESHGSVIFSQTRVGKNGRRFKLYKFRSMHLDAEARKAELMEKNEMKGPIFKIADDPRITKVGKFIRKTSLDELPQFINVLKGDMSLVGTRPPTEGEFLQYEGRHKRRLALKPGITGLWQVSGRNEIEDFEEIVRMDLEYIDNWSMWLDFKLIMKTMVVVMFRVGAK